MWGLVEYKKVCASSYIESKWTAEKIAPVKYGDITNSVFTLL